MQVGILGLPNVGKTTIFNALTRSVAEVADYPFCTIEPNLGIIEVPDPALDYLQKVYDSRKISPAKIKVIDAAGLVKGASKGEGLGNKFLSNIRVADALVMMVRCFDDIADDNNPPDPLEDVELIKTELFLSDMEISQRRLERLEVAAKSQDPKIKKELKTLKGIVERLNSDKDLGIEVFDQESKDLIKEMDLLSFKPIIYVANVGDTRSGMKAYERLANSFGKENVIKVNAKLELEILELPLSEREEYRKELGIERSSIDTFINTCYRLLDLITFYTINENEARAWSLAKGSNVYIASGKIHTDMQKGFIKAEVINYDDLLLAGSITEAREHGKIKMEGKEYIVKDRDIIQIRFSR